jgi:hypothetical protein
LRRQQWTLLLIVVIIRSDDKADARRVHNNSLSRRYTNDVDEYDEYSEDEQCEVHKTTHGLHII